MGRRYEYDSYAHAVVSFYFLVFLGNASCVLSPGCTLSVRMYADEHSSNYVIAFQASGGSAMQQATASLLNS